MSLQGEFRLGVLPLTDAAPLIVADRLGFFAEAGLRVSLERQGSWATARDRLVAGFLDGAHMLAQVVVAARLGLGGVRADLIAPLALNVNGAAVTLSRDLLDRLGPGTRPAEALGRWIAGRPAGAPPLRFGIVFPFSLHAELMRAWLAGGGIDPERDVRLVVLPPTAMGERMGAGELDGFCVGAPWNAIAQAQGLGRTVAQAGRLDPGAPDKVFAVRSDWARHNPAALRAMLHALRRAARWADEPANRTALVAMLAAPDAVGAGAQAIAQALSASDPAAQIRFSGGGAGRPDPAAALRILERMQRWGHVAADVDPAPLLNVYRPDLYDEAEAAGLPAR